MCDCYTAKCKECGYEIEMHLSDYDTGRDEVDVYCEDCLPVSRIGGVMWKYRDSTKEAWKKVFVKALTANAFDNRGGNHPNMIEIEESEVPDGTLEVTREKRLSRKNVRTIKKKNSVFGRRNSNGKKCGKRAKTD